MDEIEWILSQLDNEAENTPERIVAVTEELAQYLESLVEGVEFSMEEPLREDG
jgi:hypothetical protein